MLFSKLWLMMRRPFVFFFLVLLAGHAGTLLAGDEEDFFSQEVPAESGDGLWEIEGEFEYKSVEKGWGWKWTCPAETKYVVKYRSYLDEPSLNILYLDDNVMEATAWIRDISLSIAVYHRGKKTFCKWINFASLIAPRERQFKAAIDSMYIDLLLKPYNDVGEDGEEITRFDPLIKKTVLYDFRWTNALIESLPDWAEDYLNDSLDYVINQKLKETLSSSAAWEISDFVGEKFLKESF